VRLGGVPNKQTFTRARAAQREARDLTAKKSRADLPEARRAASATRICSPQVLANQHGNLLRRRGHAASRRPPPRTQRRAASGCPRRSPVFVRERRFVVTELRVPPFYMGDRLGRAKTPFADLLHHRQRRLPTATRLRRTLQLFFDTRPRLGVNTAQLPLGLRLVESAAGAYGTFRDQVSAMDSTAGRLTLSQPTSRVRLAAPRSIHGRGRTMRARYCSHRGSGALCAPAGPRRGATSDGARAHPTRRGRVVTSKNASPWPREGGPAPTVGSTSPAAAELPLQHKPPADDDDSRASLHAVADASPAAERLPATCVSNVD